MVFSQKTMLSPKNQPLRYTLPARSRAMPRLNANLFPPADLAQTTSPAELYLAIKMLSTALVSARLSVKLPNRMVGLLKAPVT